MWVLLIICSFYIIIGFISSKKVENVTDFLIAGRKLPVVLLGFTIAASHFGGGALVGGIQQGAKLGIWAGMYIIIGYAIACFVNAFIAPRFRRQADNLTPPDIIESRYGSSKFLRGYHSIVYMFGTIAIIAAQFNAFGGMAQAFGLSRTWAIIIGAVTVIIYTEMSGMWGVTITDFIQICICLVLLPIIAFLCVNTLSQEAGIGVESVLREPFFNDSSSVKTFLFSLVPTVVGSIFAYEYYLRYQSSKSEKDARKSSLLGGGILLILALPIGLIGAVANNIYPHIPSDTVLSHIINEALPPWATNVFLITILAAILSTADSMMTSLSGMCTRDIYHKLLHPDKDLETLPNIMAITRISSIVGAVFAAVISIKFTNIIELLFWTSPLQSGVMFAPIIIGVFWQSANRTGAFAAVICGAITALIDMLGIYALPERMLVTMSVGTVALVAGSIAGDYLKKN